MNHPLSMSNPCKATDERRIDFQRKQQAERIGLARNTRPFGLRGFERG
jgi:hypothetical protein